MAENIQPRSSLPAQLTLSSPFKRPAPLNTTRAPDTPTLHPPPATLFSPTLLTDKVRNSTVSRTIEQLIPKFIGIRTDAYSQVNTHVVGENHKSLRKEHKHPSLPSIWQGQLNEDVTFIPLAQDQRNLIFHSLSSIYFFYQRAIYYMFEQTSAFFQYFEQNWTTPFTLPNGSTCTFQQLGQKLTSTPQSSHFGQKSILPDNKQGNYLYNFILHSILQQDTFTTIPQSQINQFFPSLSQLSQIQTQSFQFTQLPELEHFDGFVLNYNDYFEIFFPLISPSNSQSDLVRFHQYPSSTSTTPTGVSEFNLCPSIPHNISSHTSNASFTSSTMYEPSSDDSNSTDRDIHPTGHCFKLQYQFDDKLAQETARWLKTCSFYFYLYNNEQLHMMHQLAVRDRSQFSKQTAQTPHLSFLNSLVDFLLTILDTQYFTPESMTSSVTLNFLKEQQYQYHKSTSTIFEQVHHIRSAYTPSMLLNRSSDNGQFDIMNTTGNLNCNTFNTMNDLCNKFSSNPHQSPTQSEPSQQHSLIPFAPAIPFHQYILPKFESTSQKSDHVSSTSTLSSIQVNAPTTDVYNLLSDYCYTGCLTAKSPLKDMAMTTLLESLQSIVFKADRIVVLHHVFNKILFANSPYALQEWSTLFLMVYPLVRLSSQQLANSDFQPLAHELRAMLVQAYLTYSCGDLTTKGSVDIHNIQNGCQSKRLLDILLSCQVACEKAYNITCNNGDSEEEEEQQQQPTLLKRLKQSLHFNQSQCRAILLNTILAVHSLDGSMELANIGLPNQPLYEREPLHNFFSMHLQPWYIDHQSIYLEYKALLKTRAELNAELKQLAVQFTDKEVLLFEQGGPDIPENEHILTQLDELDLKQAELIHELEERIEPRLLQITPTPAQNVFLSVRHYLQFRLDQVSFSNGELPSFVPRVDHFDKSSATEQDMKHYERELKNNPIATGLTLSSLIDHILTYPNDLIFPTCGLNDQVVFDYILPLGADQDAPQLTTDPKSLAQLNGIEALRTLAVAMGTNLARYTQEMFFQFHTALKQGRNRSIFPFVLNATQLLFNFFPVLQEDLDLDQLKQTDEDLENGMTNEHRSRVVNSISTNLIQFLAYQADVHALHLNPTTQHYYQRSQFFNAVLRQISLLKFDDMAYQGEDLTGHSTHFQIIKEFENYLRGTRFQSIYDSLNILGSTFHSFNQIVKPYQTIAVRFQLLLDAVNHAMFEQIEPRMNSQLEHCIGIDEINATTLQNAYMNEFTDFDLTNYAFLRAPVHIFVDQRSKFLPPTPTTDSLQFSFPQPQFNLQSSHFDNSVQSPSVSVNSLNNGLNDFPLPEPTFTFHHHDHIIQDDDSFEDHNELRNSDQNLSQHPQQRAFQTPFKPIQAVIARFNTPFAPIMQSQNMQYQQNSQPSNFPDNLDQSSMQEQPQRSPSQPPHLQQTLSNVSTESRSPPRQMQQQQQQQQLIGHNSHHSQPNGDFRSTMTPNHPTQNINLNLSSTSVLSIPAHSFSLALEQLPDPQSPHHTQNSQDDNSTLSSTPRRSSLSRSFTPSRSISTSISTTLANISITPAQTTTYNPNNIRPFNSVTSQIPTTARPSLVSQLSSTTPSRNATTRDLVEKKKQERIFQAQRHIHTMLTKQTVPTTLRELANGPFCPPPEYTLALTYFTLTEALQQHYKDYFDTTTMRLKYHSEDELTDNIDFSILARPFYNDLFYGKAQLGPLYYSMVKGKTFTGDKDATIPGLAALPQSFSTPIDLQAIRKQFMVDNRGDSAKLIDEKIDTLINQIPLHAQLIRTRNTLLRQDLTVGVVFMLLNEIATHFPEYHAHWKSILTPKPPNPAQLSSQLNSSLNLSFSNRTPSKLPQVPATPVKTPQRERDRLASRSNQSPHPPSRDRDSSPARYQREQSPARSFHAQREQSPSRTFRPTTRDSSPARSSLGFSGMQSAIPLHTPSRNTTASALHQRNTIGPLYPSNLPNTSSLTSLPSPAKASRQLFQEQTRAARTEQRQNQNLSKSTQFPSTSPRHTRYPSDPNTSASSLFTSKPAPTSLQTNFTTPSKHARNSTTHKDLRTPKSCLKRTGNTPKHNPSNGLTVGFTDNCKHIEFEQMDCELVENHERDFTLGYDATTPKKRVFLANCVETTQRICFSSPGSNSDGTNVSCLITNSNRSVSSFPTLSDLSTDTPSQSSSTVASAPTPKALPKDKIDSEDLKKQLHFFFIKKAASRVHLKKSTTADSLANVTLPDEDDLDDDEASDDDENVENQKAVETTAPAVPAQDPSPTKFTNDLSFDFDASLSEIAQSNSPDTVSLEDELLPLVQEASILKDLTAHPHTLDFDNLEDDLSPINFTTFPTSQPSSKPQSISSQQTHLGTFSDNNIASTTSPSGVHFQLPQPQTSLTQSSKLSTAQPFARPMRSSSAFTFDMDKSDSSISSQALPTYQPPSLPVILSPSQNQRSSEQHHNHDQKQNLKDEAKDENFTNRQSSSPFLPSNPIPRLSPSPIFTAASPRAGSTPSYRYSSPRVGSTFLTSPVSISPFISSVAQLPQTSSSQSSSENSNNNNNNNNNNLIKINSSTPITSPTALTPTALTPTTAAGTKLTLTHSGNSQARAAPCPETPLQIPGTPSGLSTSTVAFQLPRILQHQQLYQHAITHTSNSDQSSPVPPTHHPQIPPKTHAQLISNNHTAFEMNLDTLAEDSNEPSFPQLLLPGQVGPTPIQPTRALNGLKEGDSAGLSTITPISQPRTLFTAHPSPSPLLDTYSQHRSNVHLSPLPNPDLLPLPINALPSYSNHSSVTNESNRTVLPFELETPAKEPILPAFLPQNRNIATTPHQGSKSALSTPISARKSAHLTLVPKQQQPAQQPPSQATTPTSTTLAPSDGATSTTPSQLGLLTLTSDEYNVQLAASHNLPTSRISPQQRLENLNSQFQRYEELQKLSNNQLSDRQHADQDNSDPSNANSHIFDINTASSISSFSQTGQSLSKTPFSEYSNEMVHNTAQFTTMHTQAPSLHDTSGFSLNTIASDYQYRPFMATTSSAFNGFGNNHNNDSDYHILPSAFPQSCSHFTVSSSIESATAFCGEFDADIMTLDQLARNQRKIRVPQEGPPIISLNTSQNTLDMTATTWIGGAAGHHCAWAFQSHELDYDDDTASMLEFEMKYATASYYQQQQPLQQQLEQQQLHPDLQPLSNLNIARFPAFRASLSAESVSDGTPIIASQMAHPELVFQPTLKIENIEAFYKNHYDSALESRHQSPCNGNASNVKLTSNAVKFPLDSLPPQPSSLSNEEEVALISSPLRVSYRQRTGSQATVVIPDSFKVQQLLLAEQDHKRPGSVPKIHSAQDNPQLAALYNELDMDIIDTFDDNCDGVIKICPQTLPLPSHQQQQQQQPMLTQPTLQLPPEPTDSFSAHHAAQMHQRLNINYYNTYITQSTPQPITLDRLHIQPPVYSPTVQQHAMNTKPSNFPRTFHSPFPLNANSSPVVLDAFHTPTLPNSPTPKPTPQSRVLAEFGMLLMKSNTSSSQTSSQTTIIPPSPSTPIPPTPMLHETPTQYVDEDHASFPFDGLYTTTGSNVSIRGASSQSSIGKTLLKTFLSVTAVSSFVYFISQIEVPPHNIRQSPSSCVAPTDNALNSAQTQACYQDFNDSSVLIAETEPIAQVDDVLHHKSAEVDVVNASSKVQIEFDLSEHIPSHVHLQAPAHEQVEVVAEEREVPSQLKNSPVQTQTDELGEPQQSQPSLGADSPITQPPETHGNDHFVEESIDESKIDSIEIQPELEPPEVITHDVSHPISERGELITNDTLSPNQTIDDTMLKTQTLDLDRMSQTYISPQPYSHLSTETPMGHTAATATSLQPTHNTTAIGYVFAGIIAAIVAIIAMLPARAQQSNTNQLTVEVIRQTGARSQATFQVSPRLVATQPPRSTAPQQLFRELSPPQPLPPRRQPTYQTSSRFPKQEEEEPLTFDLDFDPQPRAQRATRGNSRPRALLATTKAVTRAEPQPQVVEQFTPRRSARIASKSSTTRQ